MESDRRMEIFQLYRDADGEETVNVPLRGRALLCHPLYNKGTAFDADERRRFELTGLLPTHVGSIEEQEQRAYEHITRKSDPLERYIGLAALQDRNEVLFYRVLQKHLEELLPIVYTPTVGEACQKFSHIFRRGRGLWITPEDRGRIAEVLAHSVFRDVDLIVATDAERILGLGDLGAGGMGIPIGKLALYTVGAGIHPARTLPICLDVGTDNRELLDDPLYVGWRQPRLRGPEYDALVEEFIDAVGKKFPRALLQWEDFKKANAFTLLDRYRERILSFNDDIQGTAAVALAGVLAAARATATPFAKQRIVILGAGAAGIGIARQLRDAFAREGMDDISVRRAIAVLDSGGLLVDDREYRDVHKREFAWPATMATDAGLAQGDRDLLAVIEALRPTVLIGTSGQPGAFDETSIRAMAAAVERPVIMPFSNPTDFSEARPADLLTWTDGRAVIATGSPFAPVDFAGERREFGQGNNVYIFPGVGLGALAAHASRIDDRLFTVAAETLAAAVSGDFLARGRLYPPLAQLRSLSQRIAVAVAAEAVRLGHAPAAGEAELGERVRALMWEARYPRMRAV
ncbi:MAG TPA: NAD-dependent malic enzyme [Gammaproteobacteria bacterium]